MLRSNKEPINTAAHHGLVRAFFRDQLSARFLQQMPGQPIRFVFHRQQLLFAAKEALLHSRDDESLPIENLDVGEVLLMASDHMHREFTADAADDQEKLVRMAVHLIPVQEAASEAVRHKMVRSYLMTSYTAEDLKGERPFFDVAAVFRAASGMSLSAYYAMMLAALSRFATFDAELYMRDPSSYALQQDWFASTKVPSQQIEVFLRFVSASPGEYRDLLRGNRGPMDFSAFRNRPLLRAHGALHLLDLFLLAEKFESGPFWSVLGHVPNQQKQLFQSFWGRLFERYASNLLMSSVDNCLNVLHVSPRFRNSNEEVADAAVICGDEAIFLEFKGTTFSAAAKYEGNPQRLRDELETKLIESADRPQAVTQLVKNLEATFGPKGTRAPVIDVNRIRTIYPVIVTRDDLGGVVGVNAYLDLRFRAMLKRKGLSVAVAPLVCMSSENLEIVSAYLNDTSFARILSAHIAANRRRGVRVMSSPMFTLENSVLDRVGDRRITAQDHGWQKLWDVALDELGLEPPKA